MKRISLLALAAALIAFGARAALRERRARAAEGAAESGAAA